MSIMCGALAVQELYRGSQEVVKVYQGAQVVYEKEELEDEWVEQVGTTLLIHQAYGAQLSGSTLSIT